MSPLIDRLPELKAAYDLGNYTEEAELRSPEYSPDKQSVGVEVDIETPPNEVDLETVDVLDIFYAQLDIIKAHLRGIVGLSEELERRHVENAHFLSHAQSKDLRQTIEQLSDDISFKAGAAKEGLDAIAQSVAQQTKQPEAAQTNPAVLRIQQNQHRHLLRKLTEVMAGYQRVQAESEARYRAQAERQIKIKYTNTDGTAIDDETAKQLAQQVMEKNTNSYIFQQSKDVLASVMETRADIYRIEKSMRELNELFNDLALLVNEQGESMDIILINIQKSTQYIQGARSELKSSKKLQKKSRKKLICLIGCVGVVILLFGLAALLGGTL